MSARDPDVPLDLRRQMETVDEASTGGGYDWAKFAENHDGRVANYIYEVATGELYLEDDSEPKRPDSLVDVDE